MEVPHSSRTAVRDRVHQRTTCRLCGSGDLQLAVPLAPTPIADAYLSEARRDESLAKYPLDLHLCDGCGHVQLLTVIDPEILFGNYVYVTASSPGLVEHFRRYADDIMSRISPASGSRVVEIGSNDGSLLRFFGDKGLNVLGVDPAREIASRATARGIETWPVFFTSVLGREIRADRGPAAIVAANNVFAHADDLADVADGIQALLADDGVFVFEVSYLVDIVEKMLFDTVYHEHLCYHSIKPLDAFLRAHGMELFDVERIPTKGGSIRGFAQRRGASRPIAPIVGELLALESRLGLERLETYRRFSARIESAKQALLELLRGVRSEGARIAGFGASHTVTTLMHHFELGPWLDFIVDDNPQKQGTFSPGYHVPVLASSELLAREPEYLLILAWSYAEMIMSRQTAYAASGGRFIVPLPTVQVR